MLLRRSSLDDRDVDHIVRVSTPRGVERSLKARLPALDTVPATRALLEGAGTLHPPASLQSAASGDLKRLDLTHRHYLTEARLLIAIGVLLVILLDADTSRPTVELVILVAYAVYAGVLVLRSARGSALPASPVVHLIDAACFLALIALSGGFASSLSWFLLFPIADAAFRGGFSRGTRVTLACAIAFAAVGTIGHWLDQASWPQPAQLAPVAILLALGLVFSHWGALELTTQRRTALMNDLNTLANPRFSLRQALARLADTLREYQRAESCVLIMNDPQSEGALLCESKHGVSVERTESGDRVSRDLANPLLSSWPNATLVYRRRTHLWQRGRATVTENAARKATRVQALAELESIANLLETDSFVSLPLHYRTRSIGRIYLTGDSIGHRRSGIAFLERLVGHASLAIENIQLVDRLASEAAGHERRRISRDLHDGTIQPYIGLKLAIEALQRRVAHGDPLAREVEDIARMAGEGITELRRYINTLRGQGTRSSDPSLLGALRREAARFSELYGLDVEVAAKEDVRLKEIMFHELLNIVREGLANIRRHTACRRAVINLRQDGSELVIEFINEYTPGHANARSFVPRSLNERARDLGGHVAVDHNDEGYTRVAVAVPL